MTLDADACYRAVKARDRRFDGRFYTAIVSTGIYCRPVCPARAARRANMRFYSSAAAAEAAGFRPCLRCRPERAPGLGPSDGLSRLVQAAVAGIEEQAHSGSGLEGLATALGISSRHLRRLLEAELGVTPIELAQTQRLLLAKRLLGETSLRLTDIAYASGFKSVRRFNALFRARYGAAPSAFARRSESIDGLTCRLDYRPPLAWGRLLQYLRGRATPGVEAVDATHYRRTLMIGSHSGWLTVHASAAPSDSLTLTLAPELAPVIGGVIARVKRLFDLHATPGSISDCLAQDPLLHDTVVRMPGLRLAGAFDGFEIAVRTVLGQQVSVKAATTLAGRLARAFGTRLETPYAALDALFPTPAQIAARSVDEIAALGIVGQRARSILALARAVCDEHVMLGPAVDVEAQMRRLVELPGIGPWTAEYIAMRALAWPDAFPAGDLMLQRAARLSMRALRERAEQWRPWRGYAAHYLWQSLGASPG
jgi:AraC family transcriptional regulator of adaptative response / DNA-3-methyladenine glycosylase II